MDFISLLTIAAAFFVVTVTPGPANLAVSTIAMRFGRAAGMRFGAGLGVGLAFWGLIAATGLGAVLQSSVALLTALKIFGGLYLLWLAHQAARTARYSNFETDAPKTRGKWFLRGLILNISNPKAVIAWMAALSVGLGVENTVSELVLATVICFCLGFANYFGHAAAFSVNGVMGLYQRVHAYVEGTAAVLFAAAGLGLLRSAISRS
ncbi:MAG: LysE family translocator [Pseudomonadota bacterium]